MTKFIMYIHAGSSIRLRNWRALWAIEADKPSGLRKGRQEPGKSKGK